ncbi:hypothetical protein JCGZ_11403 [Jatropha curcas]|uniref:Uncharacterized protein n=1 Tax=Jatropha curcas TaxID=180498 RepID=A0A067K4G7_JATCU|nr:uncharacterized protein LOC119370028 [Jatropha curcas]KDP31027.1 hypothetical protein JCGZ_11403 [Jatropha curcas]
MAQSPVYHRQRHGWETTSHDYHVHVAKIERMPSVLADVPRYPNVHRVFNNKVVRDEEPEMIVQERVDKPTKPNKKVQLVEQEQMIVQDNSAGIHEVVEKSIDAETDGYLQQKHKAFELCKWKTFKLH